MTPVYDETLRLDSTASIRRPRKISLHHLITLLASLLSLTPDHASNVLLVLSDSIPASLKSLLAAVPSSSATSTAGTEYTRFAHFSEHIETLKSAGLKVENLSFPEKGAAALEQT